MSNFEAKIAELNAKAQQDALAERERAEEEARERAKRRMITSLWSLRLKKKGQNVLDS